MPGKKSNKQKWIWVAGILFVLLSFSAWYGMKYYRYLFRTYSEVKEGDAVLYLPSDATFEMVIDSLTKLQVVTDEDAFRWIASVRKYEKNIHSGRYIISAGISYDDLITRLRSGDQDAMRVVLQEVRTLDDLAKQLAGFLEPGQDAFLAALLSEERMEDWGLTKETMMTAFIPNTYEFFWNTTADKALERLHDEGEKFWKGKRLQEAADIGLSHEEVYTLASIVYAETKKKDEAARVAGVYMNRIQNNIPLQADPTLIFAKGDFTIKRVLNEDKKVDSPYNTYAHTGLPPGPINMPPIAWIDAVLDFEKHRYLFFCAKEDFSGYHNFAATNAEHERNAAKYRRALNERQIYR